MYVFSIFGHFVFLCTVFIKKADGATWAQVKTEHTNMNDAYKFDVTGGYALYTTLIPAVSTSPLAVTLSMSMYSMAGYDAVNGAMEITGALTITWTDSIASLTSTTFNPSSVPTLMIDYRKIWTPVIVLINSADSIERVGDETYKARFNLSSNVVTWKPRVIMTSSCTPDVSYFPFDQQVCEFVFTTWFHDSSMITLSVNSNEWDLESYEPNGIWSIESTTSKSELKGNYYYATFTVTFNRQSAYFTLNIVFPIIMLSLLSGFVFLLPPASGERMGFGITCFLSFVVLLQTMMQFLPEASAPMSILCYYVIIMMTFSAVLSIITILLLKVYNAPEGSTVPKWLLHFMELIKCIKFKKCYRQRGCFKKSKPAKVSPASNNDTSKRDVRENGVERDAELTSVCSIDDRSDHDSEESDDDVEEIDWDSVGWLLDLFFLTAFIGAQVAFSMFFLVPLATRY